MQSIVKAVRSRVSADKNRYLNGDFDLDLTYITDRIIAMSFPADGVESAYRNSIHEVSKMLTRHHRGHFLIFNLSERQYEYSLLDDMVQDWCGFPDHHAPPLAMLFKIVKTIHGWLEADRLNVVVVHCLAGKGRTGTVIASYLVYSGLFDTAQEAMRYFAIKRSNNNWGITGPSQKRYIQYFAHTTKQISHVRPNSLHLKRIVMHTIPRFALGPMRQGICPVLQIYQIPPWGGPPLLIFSSQEGRDGEETRTFPASDRALAFHVERDVYGDLLVVFLHINTFYRSEQMLRFNIHTGLIPLPRLRLMKNELDGAEGDKRFAYNFFVELLFEERPGNTTSPPQQQAAEQALFALHSAHDMGGKICFIADSATAIQEKIQKAREIASSRGSAASKSGWLMKKGHQVKNWKRRWFVLKDSALSYYRSPKDTNPAGVIPVADIWRVSLDPDLSRREEMPHCFELITCKTTAPVGGKVISYVISAANDTDHEDWIQVIESAMSRSYEIGRLFIEIIEVKCIPSSQDLVVEGLYCVVVFGKQKFQTSVIGSFNSAWNQAVELYVLTGNCMHSKHFCSAVFEDSIEIELSVCHSTDIVLGSGIVKLTALQNQIEQAGGGLDCRFPLDPVPSLESILCQLELKLSFKFRSSSDLVHSVCELPPELLDDLDSGNSHPIIHSNSNDYIPPLPTKVNQVSSRLAIGVRSLECPSSPIVGTPNPSNNYTTLSQTGSQNHSLPIVGFDLELPIGEALPSEGKTPLQTSLDGLSALRPSSGVTSVIENTICTSITSGLDDLLPLLPSLSNCNTHDCVDIATTQNQADKDALSQDVFLFDVVEIQK